MMTTPAAPDGGEKGLPDLIALSKDVVQVLWVARYRLLRIVGLAAGVGLVIAFAMRSEYSSAAKILPYRGASGANGLSGLAGLAGIRISPGLGEQTITADLYPVIARTLDFRVSVAETPLRFERTGAPETLVAYMRAHRPWYDRVGSWLGGVRHAVTSLAASEDSAGAMRRVTGGDGTPLHTYDREYLEIVQDLDNRLIVSFDKKTSVISINGVLPSPYAAADLVQAASERLMHRVIEYEARKSAEQLRFIEEQHGKAKAKYEIAQRNLALFTDRNRTLMSAIAQVERDRLQREYNVAFEVFQQLSLELERARIRKNEDTPVFTVLEEPVVPDHRSSPNRTMILLFALLVGGAVGVLAALRDHRRLWTRHAA